MALEFSQEPPPAISWMVPVPSIADSNMIRWLYVSAISTPPPAVGSASAGKFSSTEVPGPELPLSPGSGWPLLLALGGIPAIVVIVAWPGAPGETSRTRDPAYSVIRKPPLGSAATETGSSSPESIAATPSTSVVSGSCCCVA